MAVAMLWVEDVHKKDKLSIVKVQRNANLPGLSTEHLALSSYVGAHGVLKVCLQTQRGFLTDPPRI